MKHEGVGKEVLLGMTKTAVANQTDIIICQKATPSAMQRGWRPQFAYYTSVISNPGMNNQFLLLPPLK